MVTMGFCLWGFHKTTLTRSNVTDIELLDIGTGCYISLGLGSVVTSGRAVTASRDPWYFITTRLYVAFSLTQFP